MDLNFLQNLVKIQGKLYNSEKKERSKKIAWDKLWFDDNNERILEDGDYEIAYEGLEGDNIGIENDIIAKLDLTMTPELLQEWVAREISRFLNQMRKDAGYDVDNKVNVRYTTNSERLGEVLNKFWEFLKDEALIATLSAQITGEDQLSNAHTQVFTSDNEDIIFTINR